MLAIIEEILALAVKLGPTLVQLAIDFGPVRDAVSSILAGKAVTDAQLAALQAVADQLHTAIQASPETE